jgi:hypothetical protein
MIRRKNMASIDNSNESSWMVQSPTLSNCFTLHNLFDIYHNNCFTYFFFKYSYRLCVLKSSFNVDFTLLYHRQDFYRTRLWVTRFVSCKRQELLTLRDHPRRPLVFWGNLAVNVFYFSLCCVSALLVIVLCLVHNASCDFYWHPWRVVLNTNWYDKNMSVTCGKSVSFFGYSGFRHKWNSLSG